MDLHKLAHEIIAAFKSEHLSLFGGLISLARTKPKGENSNEISNFGELGDNFPSILFPHSSDRKNR